MIEKIKFILAFIKILMTVKTLNDLRNVISMLNIEDNPENLKIVLSVVLAVILLVIILGVIDILSEAKLFIMAGKNGWECIVPFYYDYVKYKITWGIGWLFFLSYIPYVKYIAKAITNVKVCKVYNKYTFWNVVGMLIIPHIYIMVIAFSKNSKYLGENEGKLLNKYI